jgi:hypothetical protein
MKRSFALLKGNDVVQLVMVLAETREAEIACHECFEWLDEFAEAEFFGLNATVKMPLVADHLDKCEDCRSEFEALLRALRGT